MTDFRDWDETGNVPAIALDDMLVSALAAGDVADDTDPALVLLAGLRADVSTDAGATPAASSDSRVVALPAGRRSRARRMSRGAVAAGAAVVTVLSAGGVAAASVNAGPGSVLYPVRKVLVGPADSPIDSVYRLLDSARQSLDRGDKRGAQDQMAAARDQLLALGVDAGKAQSDLSSLEQQIADQSTVAPAPVAGQTTGTSGAAAPHSEVGPAAATVTQGGASPAAAPQPGTSATVDSGSQVDSQVSTGPSPSPTPTPSGDTASPSPTPSPSATSPAPSPSAPQQPHVSGSPAPSPTPPADR